ncbi:MAG: DUF1761 domain-containing protein [Bacteroidetes bacterium]|nr:DUF1761 domain-containing protein [Bacteroidota bacterium]
MKKIGISLILSACLVGLVHIMFNTPIVQLPWLGSHGLTPESKPPLELIPFLLMFAAWCLYVFFFQWIFAKLQYSTLKDAVVLTVLLWFFVSFPVVSVHYIFLRFPWQLIVLDGLSMITTKLAAGIALWALLLQPKKEG